VSHSPAPLPSLAPGQAVVITGTACTRQVDAVGTETGHHCVAASYEPLPAPDPYPTAQTVTTETTYACQGPASPDGTCLAVLHPQQFSAYGFGLALVVVLLTAIVVAQLRRGRA
jgi:hypothetical protein